jgi:superoxide reductase
MNRRDFMKGALISSAVLASGKVIAGEYEHSGEKKLNRLSSKDNPSVLEQKHVPVIDAPGTAGAGTWIDVKVKVGFMKEHPSTPGHWITKIKLLVDGDKAAKTEYKKGGMTASSATFRIRLDKTSSLEAIEHCNLHGTWISDKVEVKIT